MAGAGRVTDNNKRLGKMNWYFVVLQRYLQFDGRAHRTEFWMFFAVNAVMAFAMTKLGQAVNIQTASAMYMLIVLLPSLAVGSRRLHDTGLSAWWLLVGVIPAVGFFALIFLFARAGEPAANRFGPVPPPPSDDQSGAAA